MKKTIFILSAITTLFLGACKKDKDDNNNPGNDTYQPFSTGSVWKYRNTVLGEGASVDTTTSTMTAQTETINGKTFHVLNSVSGDDTTETFIGLNSNVYSTFVEQAELEGGLEVAYLNDTKAAGESWSVDKEIEDGEEAYTLRIKTTVVEKGINKTILDKAYSNVIHSKIELQVENEEEEFTTVATMDFYTAKGVGVIGLYNKFGNTETNKSELFSHTIK